MPTRHNPNDEGILRLKQILEEATLTDPSSMAYADSAHDSDADPHDMETAALRKTWQSFGQLLHAADASLPAMRNVSLAEPKTAASIAPETPRRSGWLAAVAAVAATLLVVAAFGWWIRRDGDRTLPRQHASNTASDDGGQPASRSSAT